MFSFLIVISDLLVLSLDDTKYFIQDNINSRMPLDYFDTPLLRAVLTIFTGY